MSLNSKKNPYYQKRHHIRLDKRAMTKREILDDIPDDEDELPEHAVVVGGAYVTVDGVFVINTSEA